MSNTSRRITFTEEEIKQKEQVPPCTKYFPKKAERILLGMCNPPGRTGDFTSEVEFLALERPPPNKY